MINKHTISEYIAFLYQKKYHTDAPQDLIDSWKDLEDHEINQHLSGLYNHWNLDEISSKNYENEFLRSMTPTRPKPIFPAPQQTVPVMPEKQYTASQVSAPAAKKGNGMIKGIIAAILLAGVAYYIWHLNQVQNEVPAEVAATNSAHVDVKPPVEKPTEVVAEAPQETPADRQNARQILDFLQAESNKNLESILSYFDPNLERYWDVNYPTSTELAEKYERTWASVDNINHDDVKVEKVSENTYNVTSKYSYYSFKDQKEKSTTTKVRFVFNDQNKIIKTYGL